MRVYDVIVAGTGSAGSATCLELARQGERVLGLDASTPPHSLGSHHGRSRSLRRAYLEGTSYVPMALAAWELWRKLEHDVQETLLRTMGNQTIGRPEDSALTGFLRSAKTDEIPHEELTAAEVHRRWPALNLSGVGSQEESLQVTCLDRVTAMKKGRLESKTPTKRPCGLFYPDLRSSH